MEIVVYPLSVNLSLPRFDTVIHVLLCSRSTHRATEKHAKEGLVACSKSFNQVHVE